MQWVRCMAAAGTVGLGLSLLLLVHLSPVAVPAALVPAEAVQPHGGRPFGEGGIGGARGQGNHPPVTPVTAEAGPMAVEQH
jgi:hypothetical protein